MQQVTINIPESYPQARLEEKIKEIEKNLEKEALAFKKHPREELIDSWDALDIDAIAVDTGRKDGSINHDHYIYGLPRK